MPEFSIRRLEIRKDLAHSGAESEISILRGEVFVNGSKDELFQEITNAGMHVQYTEGEGDFTVGELKDDSGWPIRIFFQENNAAIGVIKIPYKNAFSLFFNTVVKQSKILRLGSGVASLVEKHSVATEWLQALHEYQNPEADEAAIENVTYIGQREAAFSKETIETEGVDPCVLVAIINEETGEQFVGHIDTETEMHLPEVIDQWKKKLE